MRDVQAHLAGRAGPACSDLIHSLCFVNGPPLPLTTASVRTFPFHTPSLGDPVHRCTQRATFSPDAEAACIIVRSSADSDQKGTQEKAKGQPAGSKGRLKNQAWNR